MNASNPIASPLTETCDQNTLRQEIARATPELVDEIPMSREAALDFSPGREPWERFVLNAKP